MGHPTIMMSTQPTTATWMCVARTAEREAARKPV